MGLVREKWLRAVVFIGVGDFTRYLHAASANKRPGGIQCRVVD
jgi:hypothetical protein